MLHDGRTVACKLQYPNMEAAVDADLSQLRLIFNLHGRWDSTIDTSRIYEEIAARLREELDYEQEAKHLGLYRDMLAGEPHIHVPERDPRAVDPSPADHGVAAGQAADAVQGRRRRRTATSWRCACSAPGTCRSTATA